MALIWEEVDSKVHEQGHSYPVQMYRAKVPSGWLVTCQSVALDSQPSLTFYPDADHVWDGNSLP